MKKKEIIVLTSLGLVFILTSLLLKDIFYAKDFLLTGLIGGMAALITYLWVFKLIKDRSEKQQIILTVSYCLIILFIAFILNKYRSNPQDIIEQKLSGKWISPSSGPDDSALTLNFKGSDSLIIWVDEQRFNYSYHLDSLNQIVLQDGDGNIRFNWLVKKVDEKELVIGNEKEDVILKKQN